MPFHRIFKSCGRLSQGNPKVFMLIGVLTERHILSRPNRPLPPYRAWLMDLFAVVKSKDRAALLAALDRVQVSFKP